MQNNQANVRGYTPQQNTGRMNTLPYQPVNQTPVSPVKALWQQLDPAAVALLAAAVLGLVYALYATISFWWLTKIVAHLIMVWLTVLVNAAALFKGKKEFMLVSLIGYAVSMLLFMNYLYLLIPQALLCGWAYLRTKNDEQ